MIIYANLQSNLSIGFREEDFQRIITCIIIGKTVPVPVGASFTDGASLFIEILIEGH